MRPEVVIADKAYSHPSTRQELRRRRVRLVSPERTDQIARRAAQGSRGGRPPSFDSDTYTQRNVVERFFNRLEPRGGGFGAGCLGGSFRFAVHAGLSASLR